MAELKLKVFKANKDALVFVEGSANPHNFFIIKSGKVKIVREVEFEDNPNENILTGGDYFGVVSCISKRPRLETIQTTEESLLISVEYEQFIDLIKNNKTVAQKILKLYSRKLRAFDEAIARMSLKKPVSENPENIFNIGIFHYNNKDYKQAKYAFEQFKKFCPYSANLNQSSKYLAELNSIVEEKKYFNQITPLIRQYTDRSFLFCENEPGDDVFVIQEGKIKITKIVGNQEILLAVLNPGDIVGEMSLIDDKLRSANAYAFGGAKVLAINKKNFQVMVENQPQMILKIVQLLSERIWVAYRQLENLAIPDDYGRILDLLLIQIQKKHISIEPRKSYEFEFKTDDLVNMAGFDKSKGFNHIERLLEDSNFKMIDGKLTVVDIDSLFNQVEYYRKKIRKE